MKYRSDDPLEMSHVRGRGFWADRITRLNAKWPTGFELAKLRGFMGLGLLALTVLALPFTILRTGIQVIRDTARNRREP